MVFCGESFKVTKHRLRIILQTFLFFLGSGQRVSGVLFGVGVFDILAFYFIYSTPNKLASKSGRFGVF